MSRPKVIAFKNLPTRLPFGGTAIVWLLLDRLAIRGVWAGVIWTLWAIVAAIAVMAFFLQEQVDVLEKKP
jgi:hypothetical protein